MLAHSVPATPEPRADDPDETLIGRRAAPRLSARVPARFSLGRVTNDVVISDISATGARLQMRYAPPEGVRGVLSWGGIDCGCEVVWSAKNSFGVAFSENVSVPDSLVKQAATPNSRVPNVSALPLAGPPPWSVDRRSVRRRSIERPVEVRQAEQWIKVVLKGISHQGFEVGWFPRCKDSAPISLRGAGLPVLHGRVVATDRLRVCCKLREQLHDAVLNHISAQLGLEG